MEIKSGSMVHSEVKVVGYPGGNTSVKSGKKSSRDTAPKDFTTMEEAGPQTELPDIIIDREEMNATGRSFKSGKGMLSPPNAGWDEES